MFATSKKGKVIEGKYLWSDLNTEKGFIAVYPLESKALFSINFFIDGQSPNVLIIGHLKAAVRKDL